MHYMELAQMLTLLMLANGSPVVAKRIFGETYARPLDGNARFIDGRPLLGPSKTIRGVVTSLLVTTLGALLLGFEFRIGLMVAAPAMAGDMLSSFMKRRFGLAPSSKATGLDQIPEALFPLLACRAAFSLTAIDIVAGCGLFRGRPYGGTASSARHRRCKVISGRQLMRTVTIDEPTPADV